MNPIHQCFQKISPGNHFSYVRDVHTYVRTYGCTDKGDAICPPPPIINGGGIKTSNRKNLVLYFSGKVQKIAAFAMLLWFSVYKH